MSTIQVANITGQPTSNLGIVNTTSLGVSGATTLTGAATFSNTVTLTGAATFSNTVTVTGAATFSNTVTVTGDFSMASSFKRNRIINGNMLIDQRNAGAAVTPTDGQYVLDRWCPRLSQASKYSVQQNAGAVTPPAGFTNYLGVTSSSAYSVTSTDYFTQQYRIEGYNIADLAWGTANAKTITLSFQVYSSLTGTFGGSIGNGAGNRCYVFSYAIPTANTWTTISITIAGDTSGTWLTTNGIGMYVTFGIGCGTSTSGTAGSWGSTFYSSATGAVSVVGTNGATWYVTGVQLEVGTKATPYEMQIYSDQLAQCQRYYLISGYSNNGYCSGSTTVGMYCYFPVTMRANATIVISGNTGAGGYPTAPTSSGTTFAANISGVATSAFIWSGSFTASAEL